MNFAQHFENRGTIVRQLAKFVKIFLRITIFNSEKTTLKGPSNFFFSIITPTFFLY